MAAASPNISLLFRTALLIALVSSFFSPPFSAAQGTRSETDLSTLTRERERLSADYEEYQQTLEKLGVDDTNPTQSSNPAVRNLAMEMVGIKSRIIVIIEKELTLLQAQIVEAKSVATEVGPLTEQDVESRPLRTTTPDYSVEREEENVARLLNILAQHYAEAEAAAKAMPSEEELALRKAARLDAASLALIPYSADKVRLSGAEGSTALARVSQRLSDSNIPESRHQIARICSIKTRLQGALISSETRSLQAVGKNNYIAKVRLQPGDTTIEVGGDRWDVQLPKDISSMNYLITLYIPPTGKPEFHIFSIPDLMAQDNPYIPDWLPTEFDLPPTAG